MRSDLVVVCIHGWPVTPLHWNQVGPMIEGAGYHVECITPRGLGSIDRSNLPYDKATIGNEILDLIDARNVREFVVVGHDWGGTIGYLIAKQAGARCRALVVEEEVLPGIQADIPEPGAAYYPQWHGPFNRSVGLGELLIPGRESAYYGKFLEESAGRRPLRPENVRDYLAAYANETQLRSTLGYYRSRDIDVQAIRTHSESELTIPVLAVGGLFGMGSAVAGGMMQVAANVTGVVLENSGHYPAEQEPDEFAEAVLDFFKEVLAT